MKNKSEKLWLVAEGVFYFLYQGSLMQGQGIFLNSESLRLSHTHSLGHSLFIYSNTPRSTYCNCSKNLFSQLVSTYWYLFIFENCIYLHLSGVEGTKNLKKISEISFTLAWEKGCLICSLFLFHISQLQQAIAIIASQLIGK